MKLVSVNIERSKHLDRVLPFLRAEAPDVVCVQELCERDIPRIAEACGMQHVYAPTTRHPADPPETGAVLVGTGIFSTQTLRDARARYYFGSEEDARAGGIQSVAENLPLVSCKVDVDGDSFSVHTTHFTWTPDGSTSDKQRTDIRALLSLLQDEGEHVLCGDFNAPRIYKGQPGEIYAILAAHYTDHIPQTYITSLDVDLHRAGKDKPHEINNKMVDYLFSTPAYTISNTRLVFGVSDHAAVVADVKHLSVDANVDRLPYGNQT